MMELKPLIFAVLPLFLGIILYIWQSANYFGLNRIGLSIAFTGYVIGNLGLAYDIYEHWSK